MNAKTTNPPMSDVIERPLTEILSEKYLAYALSTIVSRSLPDVRDGLKPVHRRLVYAMRELNLRADGMPKKSARVVGDVIGRYHPHGDGSVYDALVRLAQDFAVRYPLVFGQGNFGNIDGDSAAAMRYTEAKLTAVAEALLEDIDSDTVDFKDTYDGDGAEPEVLPAAFPNLLANGATGIAVGMATSIPPHNIGEICQALEKLIDKKSVTVAELMEFIPAPDFPTGGILIEPPENIRQAYETGRGSFRLRAKWTEEKLPQGQYQIVITEIPYSVQKGNLLQKIADLLNNKKLPLVDDIADESAEDIRVVITPKSRNTPADQLMESLFRQSDLETRIPLNMNVLDKNRTPGVMDLKQVLQAYLDHRHEILTRRSTYRLDKITHRVEILDGYLVVYLNIDKVIKIIRDEDEPKQALMKAFKLSEVQADAILNMRLRNLRKLEEMEIRGERQKLLDEADGLRALLGDEKLRWKAIKDQIKATRKKFGDDKILGPRRTILKEAPAIALESLTPVIEKEPITVLCSKQGWIRAMKGHGHDAAIQKYKDGDESAYQIEMQNTDKIVAFTSDGRFFTINGDKLPAGRGFGDPIRLMVNMGDADILYVGLYQPEQPMLVASSDGRGFIVQMKDVEAQTKNGKAVLSLPAGEKAVICAPLHDKDNMIIVSGENRKVLIFPRDQLPMMAKGRGVVLQKYKDAHLVDARGLNSKDGLHWTVGKKSYNVTDLRLWTGERAQTGRMAPDGFPKDNRIPPIKGA
jgi:topoisomerase-4 subunit A